MKMMRIKSFFSYRVPLPLCIIALLLSLLSFLYIFSNKSYPNYKIDIEPLYFSHFSAESARFTYEAHFDPTTLNVCIERYEFGNPDADPTVIDGMLTEVDINTYLFRDSSNKHTQILRMNCVDGTFYLYDVDTDLSICFYPLSSTQN